MKFNQRISDDTQQVLEALRFLHSDAAALWMECPQPLLEHRSPNQCIQDDDTNKVLIVIDQLKSGAV